MFLYKDLKFQDFIEWRELEIHWEVYQPFPQEEFSCVLFILEFIEL
jgi:hypothetical protein